MLDHKVRRAPQSDPSPGGKRFWKGSLSERLRSMRAVRPCAGDRYAVLVSGPERIGSYALCTRSKTNLLRMPRAMAGNYAGQFCRVCQRHLAKRAMGRSFFVSVLWSSSQNIALLDHAGSLSAAIAPDLLGQLIVIKGLPPLMLCAVAVDGDGLRCNSASHGVIQACAGVD